MRHCYCASSDRWLPLQCVVSQLLARRVSLALLKLCNA